MPRKKPSVAAPEAATPPAETTPTPTAVDSTPAKPARSGSRRKAVEPVASAVEVAPVEAKPAAKKSPAKKTAEKAPASKAPASKASQSKASPSRVKPEAPAAEPAKKPSRRSKAVAEALPSPAPEVIEEVPEAAVAPAVSAPKSRSRRGAKATAAPVVETPAPKPPAAVEAPSGEEEADEDTATSDEGGKRRRSRRRNRRGKGAGSEAIAPEVEADVTEEPVAPEVVVEAEEPRGEDYDWATQYLPEPVWRSRATTKTEVQVVATEGDAEETEDEEESPRRNGRRRRRRRGGRGDGNEAAERTEPAEAQPTAQAPAPTAEVVEAAGDVEELDLEDDTITVSFRPRDGGSRSGGAARSEAPRQESPRQEAPQSAPVKAEPARSEASRPEPQRPEAPRPDAGRQEGIRRDRIAPKAPEKALIPVPPEAPQIVVRDGVPTLVRNGRVYPPVFFFGNPADERRAQNVLDEVRMAAESGVHLHSYLVDFEVDPAAVDDAAAVAAYMLAQSVQVDPESQVVFRVTFQAPRGWQDRYPDARYRDAGGDLAEPSVCDDAFWGVARTCLERFVQKLRLLELKDHILGLHLERGEWFLPEGHGYDTSRAAQVKFREWARTRYGNDEVTLRASWFDGAVRFDTMQIPPFNPEGPDGEKFIRSSRKQRRYVDYHLFLSDATVSRIGDLAYAAKAASEGNFLIGVSYGYTFEWSHPDSGHLSLGKLLRTPEVDFIAGPPSYRTREPGGSAPFPAPIDSFALNGKLYVSEEDYKTSLSTGHEPDDFNPRLKTPQALDSVHWRGAGAALAHGSGVAWMDLWGNGWLKTHSVWERAKHVREAMIDRMASPLGDPDVAVFIDERALAYLVDSHAFALLVQNVRESILRAGVSAGFYLLSDLAHREKFPESKLYLFLNAWDVRPELRAAIKSRLQRNNKVLFWLYSAGMFDAGRDSLERAREVTGIALKPQPYYSKSGTTILNRRHPLSEAFPDRSVVGGTKLEPSYFAIPEGATVLGEYSQTGLPSFVVKEFNEGPADTHWTSVFLGEPLVNPALIRALAQMSGAHVWNFHEDVVHVRPPFCTVHCASAGPRTLTLPPKYSAYNLLTNEWNAVDTANLKFTAIDGSTHCFLIGPKDDLEQLLRTDPSELLRMAQIPTREANVRQDVSNFDVPIMRLDEWIEGSDGDDNADEWFLRPPKIEEEAPGQAMESSERVGKRRRRRRGGRDGDDNGGDAPSRNEPRAEPAGDMFEDVGLSVVFRKRD